ncbi:MAG: phosphotransferase [Pseudomonadota bacterium]
MTRRTLLDAFLRQEGLDPARLQPLAGDASNRRYHRLAGSIPLVVMDAAPEAGEDIRPFHAVTDWLRALGLSAPQIHAADATNGFLLLEDLGDDLYARVCADARAPEEAIYGAAVDLLPRLVEAGAPPGFPRDFAARAYDLPVLQTEARLATEWYLSGATGPVSPDLAAEFDALIAEICTDVAADRSTVVLRDYHAENLLWLPRRAGHARVGLLDYQDALIGHPAYDLVSLLEDARRDTSPDLQAAMRARYAAATGAGEAFRTAYAVLGAQRNLKIIGIFARLSLRDGKRRYPVLIPRVWGHLQGNLAHPALARLSDWVARHLPEPTPEVIARLSTEMQLAELRS